MASAPPTPPQSRRYRINHKTVIKYDGAAIASHNELRMTPITEPGQTSLENRIRVRPMTWSQVYRDAWGTHVMHIEAAVDHPNLTVEATSTVELTRNTHSAKDEQIDPTKISWERLETPAVLDLYYEFLAPTEQTTVSDDLVSLITDSMSGRSPFETVQGVADLVRGQMTYQRGVTEVHSSAADAWQARRGVCQDFAHLTIGALRALGVPARYVSGYLVPKRDSDIGETSAGESHAWVEAWLGEWIPIDPTNGRPIELDHIIVARGRDYSDVPPFKGIYSGPKVSSQQVEVTFVRLS